MTKRRETPIKRKNPSGDTVYVARYTAPDGRRLSAGSFPLKRLAQDAINAAYERPQAPDTLGAYSATWTARHPRSERTNATNDHRLSRVLDVKVEGMRLRDWPLRDLRRRHANELVDHMLRHQGRSTTGAVNILRALSALCEDAITDELLGANPFKGVKVRQNDVRATKQPRKPQVFTWEQMHALARASGRYEPMVRVLSDCGVRIGELLGIERRDFDGEAIHLRGAAHQGRFTEGDTPTKKHVRSVPVPPELAGLLLATPRRIDTPLLFPTPTGRLWRERNFYRDVWFPAREAVGLPGATPHAFRHSWESHLHAAKVDPADLAAMAGHTVATMTQRYVHPLGKSFEQARSAVG